MSANRIWPALLILALACTNLSSADDRTPPAAVSRAWYILSQADADGLLHGLPERLSHALASSAHQAKGAKTAQPTGRLTVNLEIDGSEKGNVVLGFFADPRWWIADPIDVRRVTGGGKHLLEGLHAGNYVIGAMMEGPRGGRPIFGVHQTWPATISVSARETGEVRVRLSPDFKERGGFRTVRSVPRDERPAPASNPVSKVRVVDENHRPLPFVGVTFTDSDEKGSRSSHARETDVDGTATCARISHSFYLIAMRHDFDPATLTSRWFQRRIGQPFPVCDNCPTPVELTLGPMPVGAGRLYGRVHDQHGKPLTEFFISLTRPISGPERGGPREAAAHALKVPVTDADGRYEIRNLPAGTYRVKVRHFDYPTYVRSPDELKVTIPEGKESSLKSVAVRFDIELEAKEVWYGKALCSDGRTPVPQGMYVLRFREPQSGRSMRTGRGVGFADRLKPDGSFHIALSKKEREQLIEAAAGLVKIRSLDSDIRGQREGEISFGELSKNPNRPTVFDTEIDPPEALPKKAD